MKSKTPPLLPDLHPHMGSSPSVSLIVLSAPVGRYALVDLSVLVDVSALNGPTALVSMNVPRNWSRLSAMISLLIASASDVLMIQSTLMNLLIASALDILLIASALIAVINLLIASALNALMIPSAQTGRNRHNHCPTHRATVPHAILQPIRQTIRPKDMSTGKTHRHMGAGLLRFLDRIFHEADGAFLPFSQLPVRDTWKIVYEARHPVHVPIDPASLCLPPL